jgi:NitT/TauT family transport system ATP-binding protein
MVNPSRRQSPVRDDTIAASADNAVPVGAIARLERVTFAYPNGALVLEDLSWTMERGDSWAVIGPSGCGKTTLLYLLAGLRRPQSGVVEVGGSPVTGPRLDTGLILQDHGLLPWATALENVALGLRIRGVSGRESKETARSWLERLGLSGLGGRYPSQLSGGQRQRVAIARTLALDPTLLLMDEPFSALDALTREALQGLALELGIARGLSAVLVTHDIQEAVFLGRHVMVLGGGKGSAAKKPAIVHNPGASASDYRDSAEFQRKTHELREAVRATGAISL